MLIVGPANSAKTFLLTPLTKFFENFSNPANDKYVWLGAESAEIIFLIDFRWVPEMIAWKELLLLLEGHSVHLPSPKNHYSHYIFIDSDTPIVATSKSRITYIGKYNATDEIENEMMAVGWRVFDIFLSDSCPESTAINTLWKKFLRSCSNGRIVNQLIQCDT